MQNIKKTPLIVIILMTILSFSNLFGLKIAGITVVIGVVFFVFINSVLYGIIFHKAKNAWVSAIAHFGANLFSIIVLVFL